MTQNFYKEWKWDAGPPTLKSGMKAAHKDQHAPPIHECFSLGDKHIPPFIQERSCHSSVLDDFVVLGKMEPDVDCVFNRVVLHDKPDDLDFIK